jgi:hypothetical protein
VENIVIYTKKRYLLAMAAGSLLLVSACVYGIVYGYNISGRDSLGRFFKAITPEVFYIGAPVFGLGLVYLGYRLLKPTPAVIINQEGLVDNASVFGAGLIRWEEIEGMFVYKVMDNAFLGIVPVNLDDVLARQPTMKRFLFKMNKGMAHAPFAISGGGLPMSVEELLSRIESYREALLQDGARELIH